MLFSIGIVVLGAGMFAYSYTEELGPFLYTKPYGGYAVPLWICSIVLLIAGILTLLLKYENGEIKLD